MRSPTPIHSPYCPFCTIVSSYSPISPSTASSNQTTHLDPSKTSPPSYVLLSTEHVIAFLDIAPLTPGHVLVSPRRHAVKMGDLTTEEGAEIGRLLPLLSRAIMRTVIPDTAPSEADYNIVQNNGSRAAQIIPHVHHHIIPRPASSYARKPALSQLSWLSYGRGQRHELDDDEAALLVVRLREAVREEWTAEAKDGHGDDGGTGDVGKAKL